MSELSSFVAALEAEAEKVKDAIVAEAKTLIPEVISDVEVALEDIAKVALDAVLAAAPMVLSGSEKFGQAVTDVIQSVEKSGKTIVLATAHMAVQQAYLAAQTVAKAASAQ